MTRVSLCCSLARFLIAPAIRSHMQKHQGLRRLTSTSAPLPPTSGLLAFLLSAMALWHVVLVPRPPGFIPQSFEFVSGHSNISEHVVEGKYSFRNTCQELAMRAQGKRESSLYDIVAVEDSVATGLENNLSSHCSIYKFE